MRSFLPSIIDCICFLSAISSTITRFHRVVEVIAHGILLEKEGYEQKLAAIIDAIK
jgi:hypothetical protein